MSRDFCRDVPDPWGAQKVCAKKIRAHSSFPTSCIDANSPSLSLSLSLSPHYPAFPPSPPSPSLSPLYFFCPSLSLSISFCLSLPLSLYIPFFSLSLFLYPFSLLAESAKGIALILRASL